MSVVKWNSPSAQGANIAGAVLNGLGNGSSSAFVTYDNSSNLDLYASILINLGSFTPSAGGTITLRIYAAQSADIPDDTGSVGGGDVYTQPLTTTTTAKVVVFPMCRLYPESLRLQVTNNGGASFNAAGHSIKVRPFNENVS